MKVEKKTYRLGEEIANAITHGIGVALAIVGTIALLVKAIVYTNEDMTQFYVTAFSIFGFSMIFLYLMSTMYHSLKKTPAYLVFERLDHSAIYILIAGTYSAYCLTALRGPIGWTLFTVIWILAIAGVSLYAVFGKKLRVASLVTYLAMGWIIVFVAKPLKEAIPEISWNLLVIGGAMYTVGAVIYALKKIRWTHPLWHLFVMSGTLFHFLSIFNLV